MSTLLVAQLKLKLCGGEDYPFLLATGSNCSLVKKNISKYFDENRFNYLVNSKGIGNTSHLCVLQILTAAEIGRIIKFFLVPIEFIIADIIDVGKELVLQQLTVQFNSNGSDL